MKLTFYGLLYW